MLVNNRTKTELIFYSLDPSKIVAKNMAVKLVGEFTIFDLLAVEI